MNNVIIIFLAVIAIAGIFELRRKNSKTKSPAAPNGSYVTAAEAGPTETGRYRVEQLLNGKPNLRPGTPPQKSQSETASPPENPAPPLPDPFSPKK